MNELHTSTVVHTYMAELPHSVCLTSNNAYQEKGLPALKPSDQTPQLEKPLLELVSGYEQ